MLGLLKYQAFIWRIKSAAGAKWYGSKECLLHSNAVFGFNFNFCRKKIKNSVDMTCRLWYYIYVAYDGNKLNTVCGSGGTADALASGASGGDPVEVQILSTAPFKSQV